MNVQEMSKYENITSIDFSENWAASRKFDGVRCITVMDESGYPRFYSKNGKEFFTLDNLRESILSIPLDLRVNRVFDGEICIIDENWNEDFKAIMKVIRRKNYTIENPAHQVFDYLTLEEFEKGYGDTYFSDRYADLLDMANNHFDCCISVCEQILIQCQEHLDYLIESAESNEWEGLVIKKDAPYLCGCGLDILKIKKFHDAEYEVIGIEMNEEKRFMGKVVILHKGNPVGIGSGWSRKQRIDFFNNPELILGKTITVRYFRETEKSLRFPSVKYLYDGKRAV